MENKKTKKAIDYIKPYLLLIASILVGIGNVSADNEIRSTNLQNQSTTKVTGVIHDERTGETLIGVTITEKGTSNAVSTDLDGRFSINVSSPEATLSFTYIGFASQNVALKGRNSLTLKMREDDKMLDEVVVVGYGSMKKSEVATAITSLKPNEFNTAGNRDVRSLLEGKVAGLTVTRNKGSDPTSGVAIQLRGVVSVNGSKTPLVVIDGIPGGNVDLLRPEDIESFEILKDGSAAAIYGSSANAGVILVTTKKGKKGTTRVEYSTYMSRYYKAKDPEFMNASDYRNVMDNYPNLATYMVDRGSSIDMYDEIIDKDNLSYSHNLTVSGGSESTAYRASIYYSDLNGIGRSNQRQQYGGRVSLETKAYNNMLTIQTNLSTNYNYMNMLGNEGWESALKANPTNPLKNPDGTWFEDMAKDENKVARLHQQKNKRTQNTNSLDTKITLEPITDLKFSITGGVTRDNYNNNKYYDKDSRTSISSHNKDGYAHKSSLINTRGSVEPTVEYSRVLFEDHKLNAIAGYSYQYVVQETFEATNKGFLNDAVGENNLESGSWINGANGQKAEMKSDKKDETLIAFFGRINYVFKNRYVAQFSLRREGSSKFGKNNKWGNFSSASVAWNITNEDFMKNVPVLSNLKARLGYGETGNSGIDPYLSITTIGTGGFYLYPDGTWKQTYGANKNPNPDLKWETKKEWNFGLDFGVLSNRITAAVDIYKRKSDDLLLKNVEVPQPANIHSSSTLNIGTLSSSGIEFTLNTIPISNQDFTWKADFIASKLFYNRMDKFTLKTGTNFLEFGDIGGSGALGKAIRLYKGSDIGDFYGKRFAGFDTDGEWTFYKKDGSVVRPDKMDDSDKTVIGNGVPKFYMSLSNYFKYKDFDLSISFRGKFGFDILNRPKMMYGNLTTLKGGDNVMKDAVKWNVNASYQYSSYYIEKGDFVMLDNVTLGYTFKRSNPLIPQFRVYATARDLFTITGYDGLNPELDDTGFEANMDDRSRSPITRSITLGLSVQF